MASWMTYARKIFASIAGELEQTAQDFNDAFHSLSLPSTNESTEADSRDNLEPCKSPVPTTCSAMQRTIEAGTIPEHVRGVGGFLDVKSLPGSSTIPSVRSHASSSHAVSNPPHSHHPPRALADKHPSSLKRGKERMAGVKHPSLQHQPHKRTLTPASTPTTATIHQPESLGIFSSPVHPPQSLHSRLSQSSPSLSPIGHENGSGGSSDVEDGITDGNDCPSREICGDDALKPRTIRPRPIRADQMRPLPFSVSTPCLVQMQKILPSCKKKFNCASSSLPSKPRRHTYADKSNHNACTNMLVTNSKNFDSNFELNADNVTSHSVAIVEDKTVQSSGNSSHKHCSSLMGSKKPGKVVMVTPQRSHCPEASDPEKEKNEASVEGSGNLHHVSATDCVTALKLEVTTTATDLGGREIVGRSDEKCRSHDERGVAEPDGSKQQDQQVLRADKSSLMIERQMQQTQWRVLAPLARMLDFAYSQVVNAVLLLQNDERSISSGNNRSRASSFSREITVSQSSSASKGVITRNKDTAQSSASTSNSKSFHRRQPSQISLAGSALSSDSFEVLDVSEMESSNFVFLGNDFSSSDILHEYHLFPAKRSLASQYAEPECSSTAHSGAIITTSIPIYSQGSKACDPVFSSSADFAHFDFGELISNRHNNQLNPVTVDYGRESTSAEGKVLDWDNNCVNNLNHAMLESFVLMEEENESVPASSPFGLRQQYNHESQSSNRDSETASFSVLSDCGLN